MSGNDEASVPRPDPKEMRRIKERQFELAAALADVNISAMQIQTLVLLLRNGGEPERVNEQIGRIQSSFEGLSAKVGGILDELAKELDVGAVGQLDG